VGKLVTVTLETDGLRDFVRLPSGERYILGTVSVLKLVSSLVPDRRMGRRAIEEFNRSGQAVVVLDPDAMLAFLAPKPVRRAHAIPLIPHPDRTPSTSMEGRNMSDLKRTLELRLSHIEHAIREMNTRVASGASVSGSAHHALREAAVTLPDFGDQSKNKAFYGLGEPKVDTMEDPSAWTPPPAVTHPMGKSAAVLKANGDVAEEILVKLAATSDKVDALVAAGRHFNAAKAQFDLHKIATQVHDILSNVDLAESWVASDLAGVAKQASDIHDLFASARV